MAVIPKAFGLTGPHDLLEKLRADVDRLRVSREDAREEAFIALDCALDAWALVDWTWEWLPQDRADAFLPITQRGTKPANGAPKAFKDHVEATVTELGTCRLIATSAKHCEVRMSDNPAVFAGIDGNDKSAPDDIFFGHMRLPRAAILIADTMTLAYRIFDRAARQWRTFMDNEGIDPR